MKKKINIVLVISTILFLSTLIWLNYLTTNNVGDIDFDSSIDSNSFTLCNKDRVFQYYSVNTSYVGKRKVVREEILKYLSDKNVQFDKKSGYITFRFIVNCKGQSGRYRVKMIDRSLKETVFKKLEVQKLKNAVKILNLWKPKTFKDGSTYDSYNQIHFKIEKGVIIDIF